MSQSIAFNNNNNNASDAVTAKRYTGFPLNSTLVSSYTPDTIRSIINHAAAGQPYTTSVWIRISRVGIQISAQDAQVARSRKPVFIPIGLVHDIYMQPNINNVICIVYDEVQSNMKGVLLYVVHPNDAQLIREDFRVVKQARANPPAKPATYSSPFDNRFSNAVDMYSLDSDRIYSPVPSGKSPSVTGRQPSPRRGNVYREPTPNMTTLSSTRNTQFKESYHSGREDNGRRRNKSPRKSRRAHSPGKPPSDHSSRQRRKHRSRSPDKKVKDTPLTKSVSQDLAQEQLQQQWLLQQQQQQMAAWQAAQQMPMIPMGIYNRYVPKTIPLPTGETLKTTLAPPDVNGGVATNAGVAFIEPQQSVPTVSSSSPSRSRSPQRASPVRYQQRSQTNGYREAPSASTRNDDDETKQYLKALVSEMQSLKMEMNRMRQSSAGPSKVPSDSIQVDLKGIRSDIDLLRSRMGMPSGYAEQ